MLNCKEITHLLSEAQDRQLPLSERLPVRLHLVLCQGCRNYGKQLDLLRAATRGYRDATRDEHTK
ncbi:MAG: zf-HC2 domain-containing protein [Hylemonella sp.]|nr:zf-HC2 domain-containing protein [Hylemonella sp.]MDH5710002.1 zf-HC2 domain-containing protein [Hylemonella sp.]